MYVLLTGMEVDSTVTHPYWLTVPTQPDKVCSELFHLVPKFSRSLFQFSLTTEKTL